MTDTTSRAGPGAQTPDERPAVLEVIGDEPDGPTEYTFVPRTADDHERLTTWVTAQTDAVVDLERWR